MSVLRGDDQDRLGMAVILSLAVHNLLFFLISAGLDPVSESSFRKTEKALEVALIQPGLPDEKPLKPELLAQATSNAGGDRPEPVQAKSPPTATAPLATAPSPPESRQTLQAQARALEQKTRQLLNQARSSYALPAANPAPETPSAQTPGQATQGKALNRSLGRIEDEFAEYQRQPRRVYIGARAEEYAFARYLEEWRMKVERIGNLNYPEAARRQRLYGHLLITVEINADGSLRKSVIERSSGSAILDDAALRIVQTAAPYAAFSAAMRQKADVVSISKTVTFTRSDQLSAE